MSCCFFAWASEGESEDAEARPVPNNEDMLGDGLSEIERLDKLKKRSRSRRSRVSQQSITHSKAIERYLKLLNRHYTQAPAIGS